MIKRNSILRKHKVHYIIVIFIFLSTILLSSNTYSADTNSNSTNLSSTNQSYALGFSSYLGGSGQDDAQSITVDSVGNIYVTGTTTSENLPMKNAWNTTPGTVGYADIFVAKFNSTGWLLFSTYLGGNQSDATPHIAVDKNQNIYIFGETNSFNFPTKNAYQPQNNGFSDTFLTKFDSHGSLVFSTYLGGNDSDYAGGIAIGNNGNIYVTGTTQSLDFPLKNAWNSSHSTYQDTFISEFSPDGGLIFSTIFGGNLSDTSHAIALDNSGNIFIAGITASTSFPLKNAYQSYIGGGFWDGFITGFNSSGGLVLSTYFGGNGSDSIWGLAVDHNDNIFVTGTTYSPNFPTKNAFNSTYGGHEDGFIAEFSSNGTLIYSTYLGGNKQDLMSGIKVDNEDNAFVTGYTYSSDFPLKNSVNSTFTGFNDAVFMKFANNGTLELSEIYGGNTNLVSRSIEIDSHDNIYLTGTTKDGLITKNAYYPNYFGSNDAFIAKFTNNNIQVTNITTSTTSKITTTSLTQKTSSSSKSSQISSSTSNQIKKVIGLNDLITNQLFDGIITITGLSIIVNVILILKRR